MDSLQAPLSSSCPTAQPAEDGDQAATVEQARWLRICVTRRNRMVVQVCMPAYAVLSLADLVPDDVRTRFVATEVDLECVAAATAARGCPAGELFSVRSGEHGVRAWLD